MSSKYDRSVGLVCSTCGGGEFEFDANGAGPVRCTGCDRIFDRDELMRENGERLKSELDELKKEVVADLTKQLGRAFSGNKGFKLKL